MFFLFGKSLADSGDCVSPVGRVSGYLLTFGTTGAQMLTTIIIM